MFFFGESVDIFVSYDGEGSLIFYVFLLKGFIFAEFPAALYEGNFHFVELLVGLLDGLDESFYFLLWADSELLREQFFPVWGVQLQIDGDLWLFYVLLVVEVDYVIFMQSQVDENAWFYLVFGFIFVPVQVDGETIFFEVGFPLNGSK